MLVVHVDAKDPNALADAEARLDELELKLAEPKPDLPPMNLQGDGLGEEAFVSSFGKENYKQAVEKVKQYTLSGDIMQVVPRSDSRHLLTTSRLISIERYVD